MRIGSPIVSLIRSFRENWESLPSGYRKAYRAVNISFALVVNVLMWFALFSAPSREGIHRQFIYAGFPICALLLADLARHAVRQFHPKMTVWFLLITISQFSFIFTITYWANGTRDEFSVNLSPVDALYFTLGTLTTAGTGDISATSETAREIQTVQMGLDFILVGFIIALILAQYSNLLTRRKIGLSPQVGNKPESSTADSGDGTTEDSI
jgi:hypothetical protein